LRISQSTLSAPWFLASFTLGAWTEIAATGHSKGLAYSLLLRLPFFLQVPNFTGNALTARGGH
jgi:hypothetical protein